MSLYDELIPINQVARERKYLKAKGADFARDLDVVEIAAMELGDVITCFPICFFFIDSHPVVGALLTLLPGTNFFVLPNGRWGAGYVPLLVRTWPFALHAPPNQEEAILCVDQAGLCNAVDQRDNCEFLFTEAGEPSLDHQKAKEMLTGYYKSLKPTRSVADMLYQAGLLTPWPLKLDMDGQVQAMGGLWHIDEQVLRTLEPSLLVKLAEKGALGLAYAQLLSESRISTLQKVASSHARAVEKQRQLKDELKNTLGESGVGELSFDF